jgi:hypothetical protein
VVAVVTTRRVCVVAAVALLAGACGRSGGGDATIGGT